MKPYALHPPMTPPDEPPEPDLYPAQHCPTCGYLPDWERSPLTARHKIYCTSCPIDSGWEPTLDKAIEYWNAACEELKGEMAKEQGQQQVVKHNEEWMQEAIVTIRSLALTRDTFTVEDLRTCVKGFPQPKSPNAWGAAFSAAAKAGLIERTGYAKNKLPSAHARVVAVWRGKR